LFVVDPHAAPLGKQLAQGDLRLNNALVVGFCRAVHRGMIVRAGGPHVPPQSLLPLVAVAVGVSFAVHAHKHGAQIVLATALPVHVPEFLRGQRTSVSAAFGTARAL